MSNLKDIRARVVYLLKQKFNLDVYGDDVKEGFTRPCFFVKIDNHIHSATNYHIDKTFSINIYYYPDDRYVNQMELIDVQRRLESIFDLKLIVDDRHFNIIEIESEIIDGILAFGFDIEFSTNRVHAYEVVMLFQDGAGKYFRDDNGHYTADIVDVIKQIGKENIHTVKPVRVTADRQGNIVLDENGEPFVVEIMEHFIMRKVDRIDGNR